MTNMLTLMHIAPTSLVRQTLRYWHVRRPIVSKNGGHTHIQLLLLLITVFSDYFVYTGRRLAVTKDEIRSSIDRNTTLLMLSVSLFMIIYCGKRWLKPTPS